jgi:hypothetical protein
MCGCSSLSDEAEDANDSSSVGNRHRTDLKDFEDEAADDLNLTFIRLENQNQTRHLDVSLISLLRHPELRRCSLKTLCEHSVRPDSSHNTATNDGAAENTRDKKPVQW